jgi:predicted nucleotidyltransferase
METSILSEIRRRKAEIAEACERFGVARLDVFGSAITDAFDVARSDLDFLVEFNDEGRQHAFDNFFGLREHLAALFGRRVDLITRRSLRNPYLIREIEQNRQLLYASRT